jgi:hypothetical protein
MTPQTLDPNPVKRARYEPLYDTDPVTGVRIEALETFGRGGAGWFWWPRERCCSPNGPAAGPFPTRYAAYRHAVITKQQSPEYFGGWIGGRLRTQAK